MDGKYKSREEGEIGILLEVATRYKEYSNLRKSQVVTWNTRRRLLRMRELLG
jgi:hypothetical protein